MAEADQTTREDDSSFSSEYFSVLYLCKLCSLMTTAFGSLI